MGAAQDDFRFQQMATMRDVRRGAEIALTGEEDEPGQGPAGRLPAALAGMAHRHGIGGLKAENLTGHAPMLGAFKRCGRPLPQRRSAEVVERTLDLGAPGH